MYNFRCNLCDAEIQAEESYVGQALVCPLCSGVVIMPDPIIGDGNDFQGYRIYAHIDSSLLWNSYFAEGKEKSRGKTVLIRIPSTFFLNNVSSPGHFYDAVIKSGTLNIREFPSLVDRSVFPGKEYFAFDYFEDYRNLSEFVSEGRIFEYADSLNIVKTCARALMAAWEAGMILHQNLIPDNIRINEAGKVRILNVGIYDFLLKDYTLLQNGFNVWDPRYMSPEFSRHGKADSPSCDIYSLGGVFHMLLTGKHPYADTPADSIPEMPPPNPLISNPGIPGPMVKLLNRMMDKNPATRFGSWERVIAEIDAILPKIGGRKSPSIVSVTGLAFKDIEVGPDMERLRGQKTIARKKKKQKTPQEEELYKNTDTIARLKPSEMKVKSINKDWEEKKVYPQNMPQSGGKQLLTIFLVIFIPLFLIFGIVMLAKKGKRKTNLQVLQNPTENYASEFNYKKSPSTSPSTTTAQQAQPAQTTQPAQPAQQAQKPPETKPVEQAAAPKAAEEKPKPPPVQEQPKFDLSTAQGMFQNAMDHLKRNAGDKQGALKMLEEARKKAEDEKDFFLEQTIQQEIYKLEGGINKAPAPAATPQAPAAGTGAEAPKQ